MDGCGSRLAGPILRLWTFPTGAERCSFLALLSRTMFAASDTFRQKTFLWRHSLIHSTHSVLCRTEISSRDMQEAIIDTEVSYHR
ncbi:uncharacterized protein BO80DRAFT_166620 [Aspergillus ibericus CBS 121593]|uniref:Uncharacterized protein n=1 Tax=Aspergillus ibericus CBS 121593 TaxID=1448316 RepID=A0A395GT15_9EURO|nr:hypothetical protein BO80DRAFT_166620 [Aspergillus ibericus CBS 121593]RAK98098.1 hypothetical protein BO80DRAFT_166620 [Aspergillus ibericus CBS 121593]